MSTIYLITQETKRARLEPAPPQNDPAPLQSQLGRLAFLEPPTMRPSEWCLKLDEMPKEVWSECIIKRLPPKTAIYLIMSSKVAQKHVSDEHIRIDACSSSIAKYVKPSIGHIDRVNVFIGGLPSIDSVHFSQLRILNANLAFISTPRSLDTTETTRTLVSIPTMRILKIRCASVINWCVPAVYAPELEEFCVDGEYNGFEEGEDGVVECFYDPLKLKRLSLYVDDYEAVPDIVKAHPSLETVSIKLNVFYDDVISNPLEVYTVPSNVQLEMKFHGESRYDDPILTWKRLNMCTGWLTKLTISSINFQLLTNGYGKSMIPELSIPTLKSLKLSDVQFKPPDDVDYNLVSYTSNPSPFGYIFNFPNLEKLHVENPSILEMGWHLLSPIALNRPELTWKKLRKLSIFIDNATVLADKIFDYIDASSLTHLSLRPMLLGLILESLSRRLTFPGVTRTALRCIELTCGHVSKQVTMNEIKKWTGQFCDLLKNITLRFNLNGSQTVDYLDDVSFLLEPWVPVADKMMITVPYSDTSNLSNQKAVDFMRNTPSVQSLIILTDFITKPEDVAYHPSRRFLAIQDSYSRKIEYEYF